MKKNRLNKNTFSLHKQKKYQHHINFIHNELRKYRTIDIPNRTIVIKNQDLEDWIMEELSHEEVDDIIVLLEHAKKRASSVKPIFQVIATSLLKNT
ncbi:hypothetical protein [Niallia circulans]|jgi:hypothetical protein|uniref:hypothetical protein n=1 Tax=Niallia circulans TaxID=1397 RepID=UPI001F40A3BE|nr:hypothetical protein [Niallia circulans]